MTRKEQVDAACHEYVMGTSSFIKSSSWKMAIRYFEQDGGKPEKQAGPFSQNYQV